MAKIADMQEVSLDLLKPYEKNAKIHGEDQIEKLMESIKEFGFISPCLVERNTYNLIAGHGRVEAAKRLGMKTVPCVFVEDITEAQRKAYILADNRLSELGEWDMDMVNIELEELNDLGFDVSVTGFNFELDSPEIAEDEYEEHEHAEPRAKRGDIFQLGDHRLMCGDSTSEDDMRTLMGGGLADMVFTDPPYGVAIGDKNETLNTVQKAGRRVENIEGDTLSETELYDLLKAAFVNVRENCADDAVYFVTSPQVGSLCLMMMMMMRDAGLEVRHVLMWEKNSATFSIGRLDYDYQHEPIFYTWTKSHHNFRGGEYRTTVWKYDKPRKCDLHPTMKPVELVANAILDGTKPGMTVLDAFGGSGTTIIAAEQTGRKARVMEIDPHYCDVIIDRWEDFTGKKAVLLNE